MKVTYKELVDSVPSFQELLELKFSPKVSEELAETTFKIDIELEKFDQRVEELTKNIEDVDERVVEIENLLNEVVEIDVPQFSTELIVHQVTPNLFKGLKWFLKKEKSLLKTNPLKIM